MSDAPCFSVIIPVYNVADCVSKTLDSILAQEFSNFEIVAIDDGSTDKSVDIIRRYGDPRIRIIQKENGGVSSARNRGMKEAKGTYLAFIDADDYWYPDHLKLAYDFFENCRECSIFTGRHATSKWEEPIPERINTKGETEIVHYFYYGFLVPNASSIVIRKSCADAAGFFDEELRFGEDMLYWYKTANVSPFMGIAPHVTSLYMMRPASAVHSEAHRNYDVSPLCNAFEIAGEATPVLRHKNVALRYFLLQWCGKALLYFPRKKMSFLINSEKHVYGWEATMTLKSLLLVLSLWRMTGRFFLKRLKNLYHIRGRRWSDEAVREMKKSR